MFKDVSVALLFHPDLRWWYRQKIANKYMHTHIYRHTHTYIYIYDIYICVCMFMTVVPQKVNSPKTVTLWAHVIFQNHNDATGSRFDNLGSRQFLRSCPAGLNPLPRSWFCFTCIKNSLCAMGSYWQLVIMRVVSLESDAMFVKQSWNIMKPYERNLTAVAYSMRTSSITSLPAKQAELGPQ